MNKDIISRAKASIQHRLFSLAATAASHITMDSRKTVATGNERVMAVDGSDGHNGASRRPFPPAHRIQDDADGLYCSETLPGYYDATLFPRLVPTYQVHRPSDEKRNTKRKRNESGDNEDVGNDDDDDKKRKTTDVNPCLSAGRATATATLTTAIAPQPSMSPSARMGHQGDDVDDYHDDCGHTSVPQDLSLSYDWSEWIGGTLGSAAWNTQIRSELMVNSSNANPRLYKSTFPVLTATDCLETVRHKVRLRTVLPHKDSPLHQALKMYQWQAQRVSQNNNETSSAKDFEDEIFRVYRGMVVDEINDHDYYYRSMTASQVKEKLVDIENRASGLHSRQEGVEWEAKRSFAALADADRTPISLQRDIKTLRGLTRQEEAEETRKKQFFWQDDFATLLKSRGPDAACLQLHDSW